jgi:hypothetical protein
MPCKGPYSPGPMAWFENQNIGNPIKEDFYIFSDSKTQTPSIKSISGHPIMK